jgi:hypothetical protein
MHNIMNRPLPYLGFGLGLRAKHYPYIFEHKPAVDWFEIISENFMDTDGKPRRNLARVAEHYPIVMHGVSLSIGTVDALNSDYLHKLKKLADEIKPAWISDHLCWTGVAHKNTHDLLPVPYTEEALKHIIKRIHEVQDFLEHPIALENPSTYLEFKSSTMPEAEFIARMAEESGCNLLLDVNNVYVTCYNHRLNAKQYLDTLPLDKIIQIHLSGHSNKGNHIIDTHDDHVVEDVWNLYKYVIHKSGRIPNSMIEWDDNIPEFPVLLTELEKARSAANDANHYTLPNLAKAQTPYVINHTVPVADEQAKMQQAILLGDTFDSNPESWIKSKEDFAAKSQLAVYINAYRFRLFDVVAEDYPVLKHAMGNKKFTTLIDDFVNNETSDNFNIGRYALKLPAFLANHQHHNPFFMELCELETAISQLADADETEVLEQQQLEGMTPEILMQSCLYPRKALNLFAFNYPLNNYYRAVKDEESPKTPAPEKSSMVVFRHEDVIWRMDLDEMEYKLLTELFSGKNIGEALENLDESVAGKLFEYFSRWIRNGLLAKHEYTHTQPKRKFA